MLSSSPISSLSPSSSGMVRKRTLQDMSPIYPIHETPGAGSSSPHSTLPSFEFDSVPTLSSSPFSASTGASSPMSMTFSNSSQSSFGGSGGDQDRDYTMADEDELLHSRMGRPEMKRRRTAPDVMSMSSPLALSRSSESLSDRRGNGKDGQDVWPNDVEEAFHFALGIVPKLGRKKVVVQGRACGRNELIADFIRRKTGKIRTRKQVSSHIQVLKNMRKHDAEFMNLVSEPLEGDDQFAPGAAQAFLSGSPLGGTPPSESLLSPYTSSFLQRSLSSPSPFSPASDSFGPHSPHSAPMSATGSLTTAMKDMHFRVPHQNDRPPARCPISPAALTIWAHDVDSDKAHVFSALKNGSSGPTETTFLEDLEYFDRDFPGLEVMLDHLPCQFLHTRVNLDIPTSGEEANMLHTQLTLTAIQDLSLTSVVRIFSCGEVVLSLEEKLDKPERISRSGPSNPSSPVSRSHPSLESLAMSPTSTSQHKYSYQAPFVSDFWSVFLRGEFNRESWEGGKMLPSFAKTGEERAAFLLAISGISVIQEFVVRADEQPVPLVEGRHISPGSALGDVVLVVTYDFECKDGPPAGSSNVTFLATGKKSPALPPLPPPIVRIQPHDLSTTRSPPGVVVHRPLAAGLPSRGPSSASPSKPNLSLRIPPPPMFGSVPINIGAVSPGPITPWPQVLHTPTAPPPVLQSEAGAQAERERLERIWARDSNAWELASPALLGAFPHGGVPSGVVGSQAMRDMTTHAMAVPTPVLSTFQQQVTAHGTPFIIHPAHGYSALQETVTPSITIKQEDGVEQEVVKQAQIQDYFTGLLGPSRYSAVATYGA